MSRADDLVQALYEDPDLRDALTDDEADVLLRWAGEQAARIDASAADDAAFEAQANALRRMVKQMNRYAGESSYAPPDAQASALSAVTEQAAAVGLAATPVFEAQAADADPLTLLNILIARLTPEATSPDGAPNEPPAVPPQPDEEFHDL